MFMRSIVLSLLAIVGISATAAAQSRHERVAVSPLKEGGETVGFKLKLTLRPQVSRDGSVVRIGIGRNNWAAFSAAAPATTVTAFYGEKHRAAASDKAYGYAIYQTEKTGIADDTPIELELPIRYSDLPADFNPGDSIDVFTAWNNPTGGNPTYWHVWGVNANDASLVVKTPPGKAIAAGAATAKPAGKPATTSTRTPRKLTTHKTATTAAAKPAAQPKTTRPARNAAPKVK